MGLEQLAMSGVAAVGRHRRVSDALFRFTKWGNPFADERFSWPYPMYDRMRADGPISYGRPYRQWFVFGYDEVQEVLRSPHTATAPVGELLLSTSRYRELTPAARSNFSRWLLVNDPPNHTRLRAAVSRAFTPRQIERYEPLVQQVVGELVDGLDTSREMDVVAEFTVKLPIEAIAAILGLPARSSRLAPERLTRDRRDAGAADHLRREIDERTFRRVGRVLQNRHRRPPRPTRRTT